jgi:hypothetical protein
MNNSEVKRAIKFVMPSKRNKGRKRRRRRRKRRRRKRRRRRLEH